MLPKKKARQRSGIERAPKRIWPRHRKFVRSHFCCVPLCGEEPIEFAHIRTAENSGTGLKPHDAHAVSLCRLHHDEQHRIGIQSFERRHGIDLAKLAAEFVRLSPDIAMKESLRANTEDAA